MKRFKNIVFVKSQGHNKDALAHAISLAGHNRTGLTLVDTENELPASSFFGFPDALARKAIMAEEKAKLQALEEMAAANATDRAIEPKLLIGKKFIAVIRDVLRHDRDLVIKSADGKKGFIDSLFSTTDNHLLRKCPCPVWLIKPGQDKAIKRIVAAIDFDLSNDGGSNAGLNKQILEMSLALAQREGAELHIIHAWQAVGEGMLTSPETGMMAAELEDYVGLDVQASREKKVAALLEQARLWVGAEIFDAVKVKAQVVRGLPEEVISGLTRDIDADLLVMGTVGRTGIPGLFIGNTAEHVLDWIDCSVLALKPEGFVSPVTLE